MPKISLTTFVDFVSKSGTPKITSLKNAIKQYKNGYSPAFDYWRILREAIIHFHKNSLPKTELDKVLRNATDKKFKNYSQCVKAYKSWLGHKNVKWLGCENSEWIHNSLTVKVNPEIAITIDGMNYVIKLYFKAEDLPSNRTAAILLLLRESFKDTFDNFTPAIMDIRKKKLIEPPKNFNDIDVLLNGEADAFISMWNELSNR